MTSALRDTTPPDSSLDDILAAYLDDVESGRDPDRQAIIARYPELAPELEAFFENIDHVGRLAGSPPLPRAGNALLTVFPANRDVADGEGERTRIGYFGDYELLREIGRGGMGVVYAARQVSLDRVLAIKMISDLRLSSQEDLQRFRREAEAAAHLDHPNIVPIFEVGEHEGRHYFSMKLVNGGSLSQGVARLRGDLRAVALLVATVARAVHYAHQRGILHRDLKPANILLDRRDAPYVADFGLARRVEGEAGAGLTRSDSILGTPAYMAPELAEGRREAVTTATDVYGLGAILYELLAGVAPFRADSPIEVLRQVREEDPKPPSHLDRRVSRDLETICLKCLQKDPRKRYPSAEALADDLERWLAGLPITARPTTPAERARKWVARRPAAAGLIAACALGASATMLALWYYSSAHELRDVLRLSHRQRDLEIAARRQAEINLVQQSIAQKQAESLAYLDRIAAIERAYTDNDLPTAERLLDECPTALRRFEWYHLKRLCHAERLTLRGHTGANCGVAFTPGASIFTCPNEHGGVTVWDAKGNRRVCDLRGHDGTAYDVAFDPKGSRLATAGTDGRVRIWQVETGELLQTLPGHARWAAGVAFDPAGTHLVSGGGDGAVKVWELASGNLILNVPTKSGEVYGVAFSPDGELIASAGQNGKVVLWDARSGDEVQRLAGHSEAARCVAFHPKGMLLASGGADRNVRIWNVATGEEKRKFHAADGVVEGVAYSADGARLATGALDRSVRIWDPERGVELASYRGHAAPVFGVAFSPDGQLLASTSQDATVMLWDALNAPGSHAPALGPGEQSLARLAQDGTLAAIGQSGLGIFLCDLTKEERTRLIAASNDVGTVGASLRANRVAAADYSGKIHIWDMSTGKEKHVFERPGEPVASLAFCNDGQWLISGGGVPLAISHVVEGKATRPDNEYRKLRVWDVESGEELFALDGHRGPIFALMMTPDGRQIISAGADGSIRFWDFASRKVQRTIETGHGAVFALALSPDARTLAFAGSNGTLETYDLLKSGPARVLGSSNGWVFALAFTADGSRLASGGGDGEVRVWDVGSGRQLLGLKAGIGRVNGLAFAPGDRSLLSTGERGARVWETAR
jgi:WD40 repeat protein